MLPDKSIRTTQMGYMSGELARILLQKFVMA